QATRYVVDFLDLPANAGFPLFVIPHGSAPTGTSREGDARCSRGHFGLRGRQSVPGRPIRFLTSQLTFAGFRVSIRRLPDFAASRALTGCPCLMWGGVWTNRSGSFARTLA